MSDRADAEMDPDETDDLPPGMASFTLVLLRRPENAPDFTEEELDRIQAGHLAYLDRYRTAGSIAAAGPFRDQRDERLRGIELWHLGVDEVRRICGEDPAVRAGRMEKEVVTWWFQEADLPIVPR
jgi:uncharacterized protein YciI